jgi:translation initiation factor RLI1
VKKCPFEAINIINLPKVTLLIFLRESSVNTPDIAELGA